MHQLIDVNGENTDPLFTYLKNEAPGTVTKAIKWNFTKFLIDRNGIVIERFAPQTSPLKIFNGEVCGANRSITIPFRSIKNLVKFHFMALVTVPGASFLR